MLRSATLQDLPGILAIYNDVIVTSTAIYNDKPVSLNDREAWFQARQAQGYPVFVAYDDTGITGFSSFGDFRAWPCFRTSVEHSVHVRADRRGQGIGGLLLKALFPLATQLDKHVMIAGIDASNEASIRFHERFQFEKVAHMREVGYKFDRWLDLVFMQKFMGEM